MLCCPSRGCHTFAVLERGVCLHSEPPNSLGSSGVPWGKERVPGTSLRIWGRRKRNLCEALDGAANTRSDNQVPRAVESLLLLIAPSRSSWPRHRWFRGRSVHLVLPWGKTRREPRRVRLDDLVCYPSHDLARLPRGLPCLKVTSREAWSGIHPFQQNCCHPAPSRGIQEESK